MLTRKNRKELQELAKSLGIKVKIVEVHDSVSVMYDGESSLIKPYIIRLNGMLMQNLARFTPPSLLPRQLPNPS